MDNGKSLLDVIDDTSELFGSQNDSSGQMYNWADEFLGENEMDISGSVASESGNLATETPSNILLSSNYPSTSSIPAPTISIATTPFLQTSSLHAVEHQPTVMPALLGQTIVNPLQNAPGQSGLSTQVVQQGNQQYILKTASGSQIQLTQSQLQQHILQQQQSNPQQSSSASSSVSMMNRSVTPNTGAIPTVSFGLGTSQYKSASPGPNVNIVHLPGNLQNQTQQTQSISQQQSNQQTQQFQIAPGTFLQIPGGSQNTGIVQGQQTILTGQQGPLMNSQNTVIQNPNVVNVNVATHQAVLCNNPAQQQLQQQQRVTGLQTTPQNPFNIQGTLIQTAEGKSILIPSQNLAQPINIQQLSMAQPVGQAQTQNPVGNMIQLAQSQTNMGSDSSQNQGLQQIVLNSQGQQILVQRAPTPGSQSQNIIVRTTLSQPGLVQIQQRPGQLQNSNQTIQAITNTGTNPQLKIVQQTNQNSTGVPMINIGGQNITLQQISGQLGNIPGLQVIQQQQNQQQSTLNSQGQSQILQQGQITLQQIANSQGQLTMQPQAVLNSSSSHMTQQSRSSTPGQGSQGQLSFHRVQVAGQHDSFGGASVHSSVNDSMHRQNQVTPQGQIASLSNRVQPMTIQTSQSSLENARNTQAQILLQQIQRSLKVTKVQDTVSSSVGSSSQSAPNFNVMLVKHDPDKMKNVAGFSASSQSSTMTMQNFSTSNSVLSSSQNVPNVNLIVKQENMGKMQFSSCNTTPSNQIQLPYQTSSVKKEPDLIESLVKQELPSSIVTAAECSTVTSTVSQSTPTSLFLLNSSDSVNSNLTAPVSSSAFVDNSNVNSTSSSGIQNSAVGGVGGGGNVILGQHRPSATVQTIHLPPDLQQQFQRVQLEMKKVHAATNLTPELKQTKLKQLQGFQKKILLKGRVLATTRAEPHHIKQGLAALSQTGSNPSGMPVATSTALSSSSMLQQSSAASSETPVQSITTVKDLLKSMSNPSQSMTSSSSNILQQLPSNTNSTGPGGLSFMNSSTTSSQALSALLASSSSTLTTPTVTATNQNSSTSMSSNGHQVEQAPPSSQITLTGSQSAVSSSVDNTVAPDVAVPTQIKIASKVLTLSLTKAQRDKVQSYLDRMTPEQQQQYLQTQQGVLQRIQKQQEMNAQVRAQMLAQKKQQALSASQNQVGGDSNISTSKVPDAQIIKTEVKTIPVPNTSIQLNKQTPESVTRTLFRGQKRNYMDIPKGTLINQQIKQDQNHATNPDTKRPFKSRGDACRRLLRYHVFQSYGPSEEEFAKFDGVMSEVATELLQKKEKMFDRFRVLLLHETMRCEPSSELVMLQRMQNQDLRKVIEDEKEQVKTDPDSFSPMPMKFLKKAETSDVKEEQVRGEEKSSSDSEDMDATLVKSEPNSSETDEARKVKKLVIKSDGDNYRSSFKRQSLESSRSSIDGSETLNGSIENVSADMSSEPPHSVYNVEDEDTNDFDHDRYHSIHKEAEQAALLISSAEESQDSQTEEVENTFSDLHSRNSRHVSKNPDKTSSATGNSGNCELTSDVMYINDSPSVTINSRASQGSYSSLSRLSSVDDTRKYLPNHSPVSNASSDNDMIMEESQDHDKISNFDKYNMYQPITESLTDSEENSHYSADNSAEQNSIIIDDDDGHMTKTSWKPEQQSRTVEQDVSDPESDQEVKAQMESAINSILSLGQSDSQSIYGYNQPSDIFSSTTQPHYEYSNTGNYQRNAVGRKSIGSLSEGNSYGMENEPSSDLDVAVNSILM